MATATVTTSIIRNEYASPLAHQAQEWDDLVRRMLEVERTGGWRALWESDLAAECERARGQAEGVYNNLAAWQVLPSEQDTKRELMADLCNYERAFYNWCVAIRQWPEQSSHARDPSLVQLGHLVVCDDRDSVVEAMIRGENARRGIN
jgi:hypothetical protein